MGTSVKDIYPKNEYFSISSIEKIEMEKHGIDLTIKELRRRAKLSKTTKYVYTGSGINFRKTAVYKYDDFATHLEKNYECKHL